MKQSLLIGALSAVLLHTLSAQLYAGEILEPIVVSAMRTETSTSTAATIIVIERDEIERSGARTIAEVLRGRPGVQIRDLYGTGNRASVSLRGFGDNAAANTLILLDGRRLNNSDLAAPDLGAISIDQVERVELVYGGAGVLFGDQAVGGVVNIITRRAEPGTRGSASVLGGSYGLRQVRASVSHADGGGAGMRISALKREADHYRENNAEDTDIVDARIDWPAGQYDLFAELHQGREKLGLPGALFAGDLKDDRRQAGNPDDFSRSTNRVWRLGTAGPLAGQWRVEAEAAQRKSDGEVLLSGSELTQERDYRSLHPRIVGPMGSMDGFITLGMDLEHNDYLLASPFGRTEALQELSGVYALGVVQLTHQLDVTAGGRRNTVSHRVRDDFGCPARERFSGDANAWEVGLGWRPLDGNRVYLRAADVFRFPKADELTFTEAGCGQLDVQTGRSWEAGYEWFTEGAHARLVLWRLELNDEIDFDPSVGAFGANTNLDRTRRDGVLVEAGVAITPQLRLGGQYTWTDARFRSGEFSGNRMPLVARDQARLSVNYDASEAWRLFGEVHYSGSAFAAGDYDNALARLSAHVVGNLGATWTRGPWRVQGRVDNVLDREYSGYAAKAFNPATSSDETGFYPAPERSWRLLVERRFN
jgi:iron complex outermembrane recepter protein